MNLLEHLDYTAWASGLLLKACDELTAEELERDFGSSYGGVLNTLRHIYYADRVWLNRLQGQPNQFADDVPPSLADLQERWPELLKRFRDFVASLDAETLAANLSYRNLKGDPFTMARSKILLHVVNHGTLHRGQAMGMIRALGRKPPATDLIFFYLQHP